MVKVFEPDDGFSMSAAPRKFRQRGLEEIMERGGSKQQLLQSSPRYPDFAKISKINQNLIKNSFLTVYQTTDNLPQNHHKSTTRIKVHFFAVHLHIVMIFY